MRFRLRYQQHDLELGSGEFAVGRNASCQLSLDDPLVSRRHAVFVVQDDTVTVEDLKSRNGVLVNGQRISGRVPLRAGDRVQIGSQEMLLVAWGTIQGGTQTRGALHLTVPGSATVEHHASVPAGVDEPSVVRRADAFKLLGGVAEKALALGRTAEAERILASPLADVIEASRAGKKITVSVADQAARFSAKLANATGKGAWADYVIELYWAQGRLCPAVVLDELYNALRKVTSIDLIRLRDYVSAMRDELANYGPADRFLFQRLEGLERLAGLR